MGCVYTRRSTLWIKYKDDGKWICQSTKLSVGNEEKARDILRHIERKISNGENIRRETGLTTSCTVREFALTHWIPQRRSLRITDWQNENSRLRDHILPYIGDIRLDHPVETRDIIMMVNKLRTTTELAPKTIRHVYSLTRGMFRDAQMLGLMQQNPCILTSQQLGPCVDKDPAWRATAIYTREELLMLISDDRIPWDRQVFYALQGIAALRHGEAAGLRWKHYEPDLEPLGRLVIATSYDMGRTKTGQARFVPIHPVLASIFAEWKLQGWPKMMGRQPCPEDLVVPTPASPRIALGEMRSKTRSFKRLRRDLEVLGLRHRRSHDLRRTMISLTISDGARKDLLNLVTHGPPRREGIDAYITIGWQPLCDEVAKLRLVFQPHGEVEKAPEPTGGCCDSDGLETERVTSVLQSQDEPNDINGLDSGGAGSRRRVLALSKDDHQHSTCIYPSDIPSDLEATQGTTTSHSRPMMDKECNIVTCLVEKASLALSSGDPDTIKDALAEMLKVVASGSTLQK